MEHKLREIFQQGKATDREPVPINFLQVPSFALWCRAPVCRIRSYVILCASLRLSTVCTVRLKLCGEDLLRSCL
jgi:hypothetical protein